MFSVAAKAAKANALVAPASDSATQAATQNPNPEKLMVINFVDPMQRASPHFGRSKPGSFSALAKQRARSYLLELEELSACVFPGKRLSRSPET
jgi:hypothetical protein